MNPVFPLPNELARYVKHGLGLGYVHGQRVNRRLPCGTYVWPDNDSVSCPRSVTTRPGDVVTCPRCLAARGGER